MADELRHRRGGAPSRLLTTAATLPLLLSSIHALTQPEKHAGPLKEMLANALEATSQAASWGGRLEQFAEIHAETIARLAGASLGAVSVQAIFSADRRLPISTLIAAAPLLTLANYPPTRLSRGSRTEAPEKALRGWVSLAPMLAALIMVSRDTTPRKRSLHVK